MYYKELDILGFDKYWEYDKNDCFPYMWAEVNSYYYRGRLVAKTKGGSFFTAPEIEIIDNPEPAGHPLRFVDIPAMVEKTLPSLNSLFRIPSKKYTTLMLNIRVLWMYFMSLFQAVKTALLR